MAHYDGHYGVICIVHHVVRRLGGTTAAMTCSFIECRILLKFNSLPEPLVGSHLATQSHVTTESLFCPSSLYPCPASKDVKLSSATMPRLGLKCYHSPTFLLMSRHSKQCVLCLHVLLCCCCAVLHTDWPLRQWSPLLEWY